MTRQHITQPKPLLIRRAGQLVTLKGSSERPLIKEQMRELGIVENGSVWIEDGKIIMADTDEAVLNCFGARLSEATVIEANGRLVTPGLVDPHTHLVFVGSREDEFERRLNGATYMEIMAAGGGIHRTTRATRAAGEEELYRESYKRLDQFLKHGVTTIEAKSGYGLTVEHELKQLRVASQLNKEFNDVFCEKGVFTPEQAERILEAGKQYGLKPKIHADEIEPYQGAEVAARVGAVSADHLLRVSDEGIRQMADKGVVGVLLPGTAFFLMAEFANARKMIDAGVPVALSTDRNPGSSPTESLPLIMNLGCLKMGMTPAEVLAAATINAAHAISRGHEIGSLEPGKQADVVIWDAPNYAYLQYHFGVNLVDTVIKRGRVVLKGGQLV